MISVNENARSILEERLEKENLINTSSFTLENGTTVFDFGAEENGGYMAGKYFSEICLGGLGKVDYTKKKRSRIQVTVDRPAISCMASQYAGWSIEVGDYSAMGSGPARALSRVEDLFDDLDYKDNSDCAVLCLEGSDFPDEKVADYIAKKCDVDPEELYLLIAPTASIVGSIQISARVVETGVHKLHELGFDVNNIISGSGCAPISPVAENDLVAMGQTNDCTLYGGRTIYYVTGDDSEIEEVINDAPSKASDDYGLSFLKLFEKYERDFFKIDPMLFSPAEIIINNVDTGNVYKAGEVNEEILEKSLGI